MRKTAGKNTARTATPARKGGRPGVAESQQIREHIVTIASSLFLTQGYGATSIEAVAQCAGISKRTFYHRFADKKELFGAVIGELITQLRPAHDTAIFTSKNREETLHALAKIILHAALQPQALALHRIIIGEATRFPELAQLMETYGARNEAVQRIADFLQASAPKKKLLRATAEFAAEQFLESVIVVPQRRAMGLGVAMTPKQVDQWAHDAVKLFLYGCE